MKQLIATVEIIAMSAQALAHTTGSAHVRNTGIPNGCSLGRRIGLRHAGLRPAQIGISAYF